MTTQSKNIVLPKSALKERGVVILPLLEYEKIKKENEEMRKRIQMWKEEEEVLEIIEEGEKEYQEGKLKSIKSLKELR
ncbi:MAG: hypothetical protein COT33_03255 [Candidatus Nealsonbacteria bacterium CG08_land_8_20_14_0_20_38_20]|uniref:Uncharacterized protein n=1 Tax=Candidatus Nealsonbacteria bacterium CG08_land_8_20_14_0_20_38_20 TaxID=1974705 RepID=A0A2H0YL13_9BACT|nr:MAG: hypothetical protein COT33_03255 [Candidatus Nealsonbacteria bacterium CG08_land_8_20_14_0_20_38_20]